MRVLIAMILLAASSVLAGPQPEVFDRLPFKINGENQFVAGDRKPVDLEGTALTFAHYNPLAPQRLIFIVSTEVKGQSLSWFTRGIRSAINGASGVARGMQADLTIRKLGVGIRRCMRREAVRLYGLRACRLERPRGFGR